ncbi:MAG: alanine racemase [Prolixibacteraceae bacterium]|nr:alanine racemase [Prolixibacteraceae bacterium]
MKISRPTLVLNKTICLQNIELMVEKAKRHHVRFRPHFKTHQSIEIGRWFRQQGVRQITVSSVEMARYFASDGWDDLTIAIPFNRHETDELNQVIELAAVNLVTDNAETLHYLKEHLKKPVGIFVEISTGYARTGIPSFAIHAIETVVDAIIHHPMLNFKGFLTHSGHAYQARSRNEIQNIQFDTLQKMAQIKKQYLPRFPDLEISVGDTPTCSVSENFQGVDEIRPGNFVFYDLTQYQLGACHIDDIAVRMHCPVISKQASRNEIIIYGGAIHFSKDWLLHYDSKPSYGRIIIRKNNETQLLGTSSCLSRLSQEHGVIKVNSKEFQQIEIGDIVEIIPVHSCLTAQAMGRYITTKGDTISMMPREQTMLTQ